MPTLFCSVYVQREKSLLAKPSHRQSILTMSSYTATRIVTRVPGDYLTEWSFNLTWSRMKDGSRVFSRSNWISSSCHSWMAIVTLLIMKGLIALGSSFPFSIWSGALVSVSISLCWKLCVWYFWCQLHYKMLMASSLACDNGVLSVLELPSC